MIAMCILVVVVALFLLWMAWVVITGVREYNSPEAVLKRKVEARQRAALSKGIAGLAIGVVYNSPKTVKAASVVGGSGQTYRDDVLTIDLISYEGSDYVNSGYVPGPTSVKICISGSDSLVFASCDNDIGAYIPGLWERHLVTIATEVSKLSEMRARQRADQEHTDKLTRFGLR